ncbi:MAG: Periplasmic serine endoprotease DegP [Chlamydiae bacterium]|nr:Periplasmic serine endoprotease DegP [Chlamydiota bacterium]
MKINNLIQLSLATLILTTASFSGRLVAEDKVLLKEMSRGFSTVAKDATPAVVYIESQSIAKETPQSRYRKGPQENPFDHFQDEFFNRFFGFPGQEESPRRKSETIRGSGFIFSSDGYIITNNHVVANSSRVNVTLTDGKKFIATVIGTDPKTDLAVIKIDEKNLSYIKFGNSDTLDVGDWTIAIGNPFGLQASVTVGVVSAKGRNQLNITDFEDFIQTDAAINPGNSGGPLLNIDGEVIGINTAIVSGTGGYMGIGFAIPSKMASDIVGQLIKDGSVTRGFLGVTMQPIDEELASFYNLDKPQGALITDIVKGSPADIAGLKVEDVIVGYNNTPVENLTGFRNAVSMMPPGAPLTLKINRDGKLLHIKVKITTAPDEVTTGPVNLSEKLGYRVQSLTPEIAQQLGYITEKGVVISRVQPESPADEAAIRPGNLIVAVNRKKVTTIEEYNQAIENANKNGRVLLMIRQGEAVRFITLNVEE